MLFGVLQAAWAQSVIAVAEGDFEVQVGGATATVTQVALPRWVQVKSPDRTCKVAVLADGAGLRTELAPGCHPGLAWSVEEAMDQWAIALDLPVSRPRRMFEVWFVFPTDKKDPVQTRVRQEWDVALTLKPSWIEELRYNVTAMSMPTFPAAALAQDTQVTQCNVEIDVGRSMTPSRVEVTRCDAVFHEEAERAASEWLVEAPPAEEQQTLWTALTVGMRFIRELDGTGGRVEVALPDAPDLGGRAAWEGEDDFAFPESRPMPETEALLLVAYRGYREVGVYDIVWPNPVASDRTLTCDVLMLVNDERQVFAWPQGDCDDQVRAAVSAASRQWFLHATEARLNDYAARFRGTFVFPKDGSHVRFRMDERHVVEIVDDELEPHIEKVRAPTPIRRMPPKIAWWRDIDFGDRTVDCTLEVEVAASGKPRETRSSACSPALYDVAKKTISKWRWAPAAANGRPIASRVEVTMRFDPRAQSR